MNLRSLLESISVLLEKARATAATWPRIPPVLIGELAAILALLRTVREQPRLNLTIAVAAYLFARYGVPRLGSTRR